MYFLATTFPTAPPTDPSLRLSILISSTWLLFGILILSLLIIPIFFRRRRIYLLILSTLLCLAVAFLWIFSNLFFDPVLISHTFFAEIASSGGQLFFTWSDTGPPASAKIVIIWRRSPQQGRAAIPSGRIVDASWRHLRFGSGSEPSYFGGKPSILRRIIVPYWFVFSTTAVYPVILGILYFRRHRQPRHHCPTCGYDLRATPTLCPECGHQPAKPAVQ
jgi:hypothetical protein